ncbi:MAG: multidrug MFS transporter [Clostridiales bacterium]|nr:multidrug MFS transporter [Clostridiales bacterium]
MIFVTVGTHEQPFNRLLECVDKLKEDNIITEEVIMQTGFSTYVPKNCEWKKLFPYDAMIENVKKARIVITHGGPSSFVMPLQEGKIPIVVPRQKKYEEHVNDHQVDFAKAVAERQKNIIVVTDIEVLKDTLLNYDNIITKMDVSQQSNNANFNKKLEIIINELFK